MIYILLEQKNNIINPVEDDFVKKYHRSSVKRFGEEEPTKEDLELFEKPPLLNNEWLIICSWLDKKTAERFRADRNVVLLKVTRRNQLTDVVDKLEGCEYRIIDNYQIDKEVMIHWVMYELHVDHPTAGYLYNRVLGHVGQLVDAVGKLKVFPVISKSLIRQNVEPYNTVNVFSMVQFLCGISSGITFHNVAKTLYYYRYAGKWLKNSLVQELQLYLEVFTAMDCGELDLTNFRQFIEVSHSKMIRECKPYRVQKIIECHRVVSTELIIYLILQIQSIPNGVAGIRCLLELFKAGGSNVYSM